MQNLGAARILLSRYQTDRPTVDWDNPMLIIIGALSSASRSLTPDAAVPAGCCTLSCALPVAAAMCCLLLKQGPHFNPEEAGRQSRLKFSCAQYAFQVVEGAF